MAKLVLVHGLPDNSGVWDKVAAGLSTRAIDFTPIELPGFAENERLNPGVGFSEIAIQVQQRLPDGPLIYVGHDFGGILGTMLASNSSSKIEKLILINAPTPDILKSTIMNDKDQSRRSGYAQKIVENPRSVLPANDFLFLKSFLFKDENSIPDQYASSLVKMWSRADVQDTIGSYYRSFLNSEIGLVEFDQSCIQIWSTYDPFLGSAVRDSMRKNFPQHRVESVATDSHWPQLSCPDKILQIILGELEK